MRLDHAHSVGSARLGEWKRIGRAAAGIIERRIRVGDGDCCFGIESCDEVPRGDVAADAQADAGREPWIAGRFEHRYRARGSGTRRRYRRCRESARDAEEEMGVLARVEEGVVCLSSHAYDARDMDVSNVTSEIAGSIAQAREAIASADALLIAAGAGMGVDSGLPDFRGPEGFWRAYPAAKLLGLRFEELANPKWFDRDPHLAWGFYGQRRNLYLATTPHEGFEILLNWARQKDSFVFTSNVDSHFQMAGFAEERIIECHGSLAYLQCSQPCSSEIWANTQTLTINETTLKCADPLPKCPRCGAISRPNVLMFGDSRWLYERHDVQADRFAEFLQSLEGRRVAIIECGAGTGVPTVRMTCERLAAASDHATLIRINTRDPQTPRGHVSLKLGALEALRLLESGVA